VTTPNYSLGWILPFVRESLKGRGNFSYGEFLWGLWPRLERVGVPGIVRTPPERMYSNEPYDYKAAPYLLRTVAVEAFYYLLHNGFTIPEPPEGTPLNLNQSRFMLTRRGVDWAAGVDPLPEDVDRYMSSLRSLVPELDPIIEQYIGEALSTFERQTYFAAAVMVGAAAEKAVYLLADSLVGAIKDATRQASLQKVMERRRLNDLFHLIEKTIHDAYTAKVLPYAIFDGAVSHLMSLIEAIKVQRNDAVHPMNAAVSPDSVRLSLRAFPFAMQKLEALREWFLANPKAI
jgi:hypothetical protein